MGHSKPLFRYFRLFTNNDDGLKIADDSSQGSLVSAVTALPAGPQPLPKYQTFYLLQNC